mmetsp:Transcript_58014/g.115050  ORF Transcript_58014/g.115050 Transcript_58014/m.115050 type:complete len:90 (-) Transcript_58014:16-285(-)
MDSSAATSNLESRLQFDKMCLGKRSLNSLIQGMVLETYRCCPHHGSRAACEAHLLFENDSRVCPVQNDGQSCVGCIDLIVTDGGPHLRL